MSGRKQPESFEPCGKTLGHGERCCVGYLCGTCTKLEILRAQRDTSRAEAELLRSQLADRSQEIMNVCIESDAAEQQKAVMIALLKAISTPIADGELFTPDRFKARAAAASYLASIKTGESE